MIRGLEQERQYTLGDDLLVAPAWRRRPHRAVYLAGQWVDFWGGAVFDGGREIVVDAPLERIPVFARAAPSCRWQQSTTPAPPPARASRAGTAR